MEPEFADLVPLFVAEAHGRLEHLAELAAHLGSDAGAAGEARRELHTLKGAGRMLRLAAFAELCHAAESAILSEREDAAALLTRVADDLAAMVDAVAAGRDPVVDPDLLAALAGATDEPARPQPGAAQPRAETAAAAPAHAEVRIDAARVDALAEGATRLRILAAGARQTVDQLHSLVRLTEAGAREDHPRQTLAALTVVLRQAHAAAEAAQLRLQRAAEEQLEGMLALQLQPMQGLLLALARHARELARTLGRELEVEVAGGETRLDRRITRELEEALLHVVRNAVDHGIEAPDARATAGKPRRGTVRIAAVADGRRVRLTVGDDGAGIDPAAVVAAAVRTGVIDGARARSLDREEALRLLFLPGFSTRGEVTELSGRGVGLDAVAAVASRVGGSVAIDTDLGHGTTVAIDVPVARRGEEVAVVRVGQVWLALPAAAVQRVDRVRLDEVVEVDGRAGARIGDRLVPFVALASLLGEQPAAAQFVLQGTHAGMPVAVAVDAVERTEEVLVRPGGRALGGQALCDGVALLASGRPVAVLSLKALGGADSAALDTAAPPRPRPRRLRILLAEDSLVTREMERRLLEDAGFEVTTAGDGDEALAALRAESFDCLVTDVEMPGLDGYALTRRVRADPELAQLPVVVVSTHDRPDDRLRGLEAGADAYLTKQSLSAAELVALVRRLAGA